ncbi:MAG: hypothetical protein AAGG02_12640 [Cyanobacteria bacterium P01_H01_bin.15]
MKYFPKWLRFFGAVSLVALLLLSIKFLAVPILSKASSPIDYEIWGSDQSNSRSGVEARGVSGSWIWIWDRQDLEKQLETGEPAQPIGCDGKNQTGTGPCDLYTVFPSDLIEHDTNGATGNSLADLPSFGRLHGMLPDPQNRYMNMNIFAPQGGYIGIMDGETKAAIALFRVSGTSSGRSVHMSFWNSDGSALLIANLHGKVLERIDLERDSDGKIVNATFNRSASLGFGKSLEITEQPKVYLGNNAQGQPMIGEIAGSYDPAAMGDLTPNGICKENDCPSGQNGGRANNVVICPIVSDNDLAFATFGGGGLLVANTRTTPMTIVGEYDNATINGAGCGGVQVGQDMWLNAGISASGAGANQSTFTLYTLDTEALGTTEANKPNSPKPAVIFKDDTNTATIGNATGPETNETGQLPGQTTRRDSHGMAKTLANTHVHTVDRIQNNVEVINVETGAQTTYDLTTADGQGNGLGPCQTVSVSDDPNLPGNDPAPDLLEPTPDGKYLVVALRGPIPVSVNHAAQGSCPGVGIIELTEGRASGRLVTILRSTNTVDTSPGSAPGGYDYQGTEHSDIHGAAVRRKLARN